MTELDIAEVTKDFGETYELVRGKNGWDNLLKDAQTAFFNAATAELEKITLARQTVRLPPAMFADVGLLEDYVAKHHPGWRIIDEDESMPALIIEEDPKLKAYSYLNTETGMVYKRSQTGGFPVLDNERLAEEDPELWYEITELAYPWLLDLMDDLFSWRIDEAEGNVFEQEILEGIDHFLIDQGIQSRGIKDPSEWTDDQSARVQKYMVLSPVSVKLTPPRKAKPEELETGEVQE